MLSLIDNMKKSVKNYNEFLVFVGNFCPKIQETQEHKAFIEKALELKKERKQIKEEINQRMEKGKLQLEKLENEHKEIKEQRGILLKQFGILNPSVQSNILKFVADYESDDIKESSSSSDITESESYKLCKKLGEYDLMQFLLTVKDRIKDLNDKEIQPVIESSAQLMINFTLYVDYCKSETFSKKFKFRGPTDSLYGFIISELDILYSSHDGSCDKLKDPKYMELFENFISSALYYYISTYRYKKETEKIFTVEFVDKLFTQVETLKNNELVRETIRLIGDEDEDIKILQHFKRSNVWLYTSELFILIQNIFIQFYIDLTILDSSNSSLKNVEYVSFSEKEKIEK
jgi:hypothetical protein